MDVLLSRVTHQAVQYAIRSGISITTGYAISSAARLLKEAPKGKEREELMQLQLRLESKIRVISPSIDMIELISARGNTSLESAVSLTKDIRYEIQKLGVRLSKAAEEEAMLRRNSSKAKSREETDIELIGIINQVKLLLARIEDAVPLINLAITTSGVNLSTKLSGSISPSRLLQASTFLTSADGTYASTFALRQQVGPTYILTMFMLFAGHSSRPVDENGVRETTWKEVIHKARVKLWRLPVDQLYALPGETLDIDESADNTIPAEARAAEFAYQLTIVEDLNDDRVHTFEEDEPRPPPFDDVANAGIRDVIPIHEVSKIFYADTGKILNIVNDGDAYSPVLLLKRDVHAEPPRRMARRSQSRNDLSDDQTLDGHDEFEDEQSEIDAQFERESTPSTPFQSASKPPLHADPSFRLPADLDPEWYAFEVYTEAADSDSEDEATETSRPSSRRSDSLVSKLANLTMKGSTAPGEHNQLVQSQGSAPYISPPKRNEPPVKTSLSLLEMLMKLAALQQFRQESHLAIEDELLNFFLEDSATAGAGADKEYRQRLRHQATKRVGFDPYDESPIKHRNEDYIRGLNDGASQRGSPVPDAWQRSSEIGFDESLYGYHDQQSPSRLGFVPNFIERGTTPSSPSPRLTPYQQTTSRASTPEVASSESHRNAVSAKYSASPQPLATPPSISRTRSGVLRTQSEQRPRSPLHESVTSNEKN